MIVEISDDFDLGKIADSGQCFRWTETERNSYRIIAGESCLFMTSLGDNRYDVECTTDQYEYFWKKYFDLQENYHSIRSRIDPEQDPFLWQAARLEQGIRILRQDPWEMLITFILSQNKNIPAIRCCVERLAKRCGNEKTDSRGQIYYGFPGPGALAALSEKELRECGLGYRWKYVHAAAAAVAAGEIDLERLINADEDTTMTVLTGLYGVGIKVANCVSLFGLHHTDAFPIDVWVRRILAEQYPDGYPFQRYSPYNGVCQQYMFAYYRHRRKKE